MSDVMSALTGSVSSVDNAMQQFSLNDYIVQAMNNQFFQGIFLAGLLASLVYLGKKLGKLAILGIKKRFTVEILVNNTSRAFDYLLFAFDEANFEDHSTRFRMSVIDNDTFVGSRYKNERVLVLYPGDGMHLLWYKNHPLFIRKSTKDDSNGRIIPEEFTITTFSWNKHIVRDFIQTGQERVKRDTDGMVEVSEWINSWQSIHKNPRPMSSVFIDKEIKNKLLSDMRWFLESREWFIEKGIPYHRGYLLYGPPGTGKTSIALALASEFKMPLMTVNMGSIATDRDMKELFHEAGPNTIMLLEDVDACSMTHSRNDGLEFQDYDGYDDSNNESENQSVKVSLGPTLSGLLNVLDGVTSNEKRIVIMTTNDPSKLDSALVRPGRIDHRFHIGYQNEELRSEMFQHFVPENENDEVHREFLERTKNLSPAEVQNELMQIVASQ